MKTLNMKKTLTVVAVLATISFSSVMQAEEFTLPVVSRPAILEEGTQRELSRAQIAELLPWAKNSKLFLTDLLENIQPLNTADKIESLVSGISSTVGESAPKHSELLMRYALNRGLVLNEILSKEMDPEAVGTQDAKLRVLKASIHLALKYYETDLAVMSAKMNAPFVSFGLDYFNFLNEINKSIFDASAQYTIQRTSLEWLQWDLYRDLNNTSYAAQIVKINNGLKTLPTRKLSDSQSISYIRQMKALSSQLKISEVMAKLERDREAAMSDAERQAIRNKREQERLREIEETARLASERAIESFRKGSPVTLQAISRTDVVIYNNTIRTISHVSDDGQVVMDAVDYRSSPTAARRTEVQKAFESYAGLSSGRAVIVDGTVRTVKYIGEAGTVVLNATSYRTSDTFVSFNSVSKAVTSFDRFNQGDQVLHQGTVRTIAYLGERGEVVLEARNYRESQTHTTYTQVSKVN